MDWNIELYPATMADASRIAVMSRALIETGLGWSWRPVRVASNIRSRATVVLAARARIHAHKRLIGFGIMHYGRDEAHLNLLGVDPDYQRRGIGRRLMAWLEETALVAGVGVVYLEVRSTNAAAQAFYTRLGYRKIARVAGYYRGTESALRMGRDLWVSASTKTLQ